MEVRLAVLGALLISAGIGWWNPQVGVVTAGVECVTAAYVVSYLKVRTR